MPPEGNPPFSLFSLILSSHGSFLLLFLRQVAGNAFHPPSYPSSAPPLPLLAFSLFLALPSLSRFLIFSLFDLSSTHAWSTSSDHCFTIRAAQVNSKGAEIANPNSTAAQTWRWWHMIGYNRAVCSRRRIAVLRWVWRWLLVPTNLSRHPLPNGTLFSRRKCQDNWHVFPCKNRNFASGSKPNRALFWGNNL